MNHRLTLLSALIVTGILSAQTPEALESRRALEERVAPIRAQLAAQRSQLGLNERHDFSVKSVLPAGENQRVVRFNQTFQGLRVWGGETLVHTDAAGNRMGSETYAVRAFDGLNVEPVLQASEAISRVTSRLEAPVADGEEGPVVRKGTLQFLSRPTAELLVYPILRQVRAAGAEHKADSELLAVDVKEVVDRVVLAYYVQVRQEVKGLPVYQDALVDAHTGEILEQWDALQRGNVKGTGKTLYSGTVTLDVNYTGSQYQMLDTVRATSTQFNVKPYNGSTIYTSTTSTFGTGYTSDTKTVAADALWGAQAAYDCFYNVFGWKGINGSNSGLNIQVHMNDDNAYFNGVNTIVFGDGISYFNPLVEVDVVAHEYGHALCGATADLVYSKQQGGLNEANSDILATAVEFYAAGGKTGSTIPSSGGNWLLGNKVSKDGQPLRWMYKPSKDGQSPDYYTSTIDSLDVHYSSGPANRMFYFLSNGSTSSSTPDYYSSKLTYGAMTGIGIDKAARIWFKAITQKMTSTTNYAGAYSACKWAAESLYGVGSKEAIATQRAFAAIGVASDISEGTPTPTIAVTVSPKTATVKTGATYQFTAAVTGTTNTAVTWTTTGGTISTTGLFTAPSTAGTYTITATSKADTLKKDTATVTVSTNPTPTGELILNGGFESGATSWAGSTGSIGNWNVSPYYQPAYAGVNASYLGGNGTTTTETLYQTVTIPSTATSATLSFRLHIDTKETTTYTAYDKLGIQVRNSSGTLLKTLATYSNLNKATGYQLRSFDVSAYRGQTIRVHFNMAEDSMYATNFLVDNVSLLVQ